jgi:hypothetical protein
MERARFYPLNLLNSARAQNFVSRAPQRVGGSPLHYAGAEDVLPTHTRQLDFGVGSA